MCLQSHQRKVVKSNARFLAEVKKGGGAHKWESWQIQSCPASLWLGRFLPTGGTTLTPVLLCIKGWRQLRICAIRLRQGPRTVMSVKVYFGLSKVHFINLKTTLRVFTAPRQEMLAKRLT